MAADGELNSQFPLAIDPGHCSKQKIARLTQVKNEGREAWHYTSHNKHKYLNAPEAQSDSKSCSWSVIHWLILLQF